MGLIPFRRKSRTDIAREKVADFAGQIERVAGQVENLAEPVPERARRPLRFVVIGIGAGTAIYVLRRLSRTDTPTDDVPSPGQVSPTAPAGPTQDRLNDPALKAKVESELFSNGGAEIPKGKVTVGAADGVVTLRGKLDSVEQTTKLTEAAEQIDGVRRVENLLTFDS